MDVPLILESEYVPEWRSNKLSAAPIQVTLQPLTGGQRAECIGFRTSEGVVTGHIDMPRLVEYGVKEIRGFSAGGEAVTTGRGLVRSKGASVEQLILELAAEIILRNQETDLKNS